MYIFVEMWNPKQAWLDLPTSERTAYVAAVGGAVESVLASGVEIITWSFNDNTIDNFNGFQYFAIWKFPTLDLVTSFQKMVVDAGWYNYFEQVNASGLIGGPGPVLDHSIVL
ncbi:DUF6616 family protein [Dyadobacter sp. 3J3]|uniref:DUF6616 family protein n=1 Tax=Dyadobacter sp. 3J3 TaxID=2606600 RepID=UPI00135C3BE0|nr:DUF6616 family protein [Dyadobacter sp. 3J3]